MPVNMHSLLVEQQMTDLMRYRESLPYKRVKGVNANHSTIGCSVQSTVDISLKRLPPDNSTQASGNLLNRNRWFLNIILREKTLHP